MTSDGRGADLVDLQAPAEIIETPPALSGGNDIVQPHPSALDYATHNTEALETEISTLSTALQRKSSA